MSDEHENFDLDRDIINPYRTPPLEPIKPNFESTETPPPLVTQDSSSDSSEGEERGEGLARKRKRRKGRTKPSYSDAVLIRHIDPNHPEVAKDAYRYALNSATPSEGEEEDQASESDEEQMRESEETRTIVTSAETSAQIADAALKFQPFEQPTTVVDCEDEDFPMVDDKTTASSEDTPKTQPVINGDHKGEYDGEIKALSPKPQTLSTQKQFDVRPPPLRGTRPTLQMQESSFDDTDSLATSPTLAPFTINPLNPDPGSTLPAMQKSPPRSHAASSPEFKHTLPSLTTALSQVIDSKGTPFPSQSPTVARPSPGHRAQFGPSPSAYSNPSPSAAMSPPSVPSHPSYWRTSTRTDSSLSTASDHASLSATTSTPASSVTAQSPVTLYQTPTFAGIEQGRQRSPDELDDPPELEAQQSDGTLASNGSYANGGFKCNVPGCNAIPFQTQYLLNSHMNVHSNTRPHFCPVKGCARGPDGQGFKRKNEMIRHGLVHTSPGYMCPFCPDQQHKYPRPDNLQRHVRVHHMDKDRDDPALRDVLAQRPEGGNRGRRRRLGS